MTATPTRPPAWDVLEQALRARRPVTIRYHSSDRTVCPHALGWKNGRAKLLAYQTGGTTSTGTLPADARQRWRTLFIDDIEHADNANSPWQSADNYTATSNGIDRLAIAITI